MIVQSREVLLFPLSVLEGNRLCWPIGELFSMPGVLTVVSTGVDDDWSGETSSTASKNDSDDLEAAMVVVGVKF
jgi:hypothetical protein